MLTFTPASPKLILFHLCASCCFLLSYHVVARAATSTFSFSFDFTNRSTYRPDDLRFEGDAVPLGEPIDLTCNSRDKPRFDCNGRMSYNHPVRFYDTSTGEVASFSTRFNFAISLAGKVAGDGMAFFLSSYPSMLPPNSRGAKLGLHDGSGMYAEGTDRIVAVEFDTYKNDVFENSSDHIAIDINTVQVSVNTTSVNGALNGSMTAIVTFNGSTRMLVAFLQFDDEPSRGSYQVSTQLTNPVDLLPSEVAVGFSAATGRNVELHQIMSWSFTSTLARKEKKTLVIFGALGSLAVMVIGSLVVWIILAYFKWRHRRDSYARGISGLRRFDYGELVRATGKFSKENTLGTGNFGTVYKGSYTVENVNQEAAVKEIKKTTGAAGDFMAELKTISQTKHKYLVELKGWCCSRNRWNLIDFMFWYRQQRVKLFLVYELVPNGTLEDHLHKMEETLPWEKRYQIVMGIGSALRYLHHECNKTILHRDIKPGNILLDYDLNVKLADFGLSRIIDNKNTKLVTSAIGTVGYMDPECMKHGNVEFNRKSDVYSFEIVLLEIASRKNREQVMEWRRSSTEPRIVEVADEKLDGVFDQTQMERVIALGLECSQSDGKQRPYMLDAMKFLEESIELRAINKINDQQDAPGTFSSDEHALLPIQWRS